MYGEETAMHLLPNISRAVKQMPHPKKDGKDTILSYAHFIIAYCAFDSGNLSWLENLDDKDVYDVCNYTFNKCILSYRQSVNKY
jgi:hypothetical protein